MIGICLLLQEKTLCHWQFGYIFLMDQLTFQEAQGNANNS